MSKRSIASIDFTKTKSLKTEDMKVATSEKRVWKDFVFKGEEVPSKETLNELLKNYGEKFTKMFKSMYTAETLKLSGVVPVSSYYCKLTFSCTKSEQDEISAFYLEKGFVAEVSDVVFRK